MITNPDIHQICTTMLAAAVLGKQSFWRVGADFLPTLFFQRGQAFNVLGITGDFDGTLHQWETIRRKIGCVDLVGFVSDAYMKRFPVDQIHTLESWSGSDDPTADQALIIIAVSKTMVVQMEVMYRVGDHGELEFSQVEQTDISGGFVVEQLRKAVGAQT